MIISLVSKYFGVQVNAFSNIYMGLEQSGAHASKKINICAYSSQSKY